MVRSLVHIDCTYRNRNTASPCYIAKAVKRRQSSPIALLSTRSPTTEERISWSDTGISPNLPNIYPVTLCSHRLHSFVKSVIVLNAIFETDSNPFRLRISPIILLRTSSTGFFCMVRWNQVSGLSKNGPFQEQRGVC